MSAIEVTTQAQLDKAVKALKPGDWIVCLGGTWSNPLRAYGNASVEAYGNASVEAYGNASVEAYGNASVQADGNASVRADGNASVRADGNASVEADGNASVRAGKYVAVHKFATHRGKLSGGVVIELPDFAKLDAAGWCDYRGVSVQRGYALLYKAVDDDFSTSYARSKSLFYTVGATVAAPDWNDRKACGGGLHLCSLPWISRRYNRDATHYVQVKVKLADLVVIDEEKVKASRLVVVCECDIDGDPLKTAEVGKAA